MTGELKTLQKGTEEFDSYLKGTFSSTHRALPLQTLNANTQFETVTFQIVPVSEIHPPNWLLFFAHTFKAKNFLLVLFPLFLILVKNIADRAVIDPFSAVISTLGILCAFISLSLRNDYLDHLRGIDRVIGDAGSRSIQKGWTTAQEVKKYAVVFLALALFCALLIVVAFPPVLIVLAVSLLAGWWAYSAGGELSLFLLLGPLLTVGYQLSMGANFDIESLLLGFIWGWLVLYLVHLKNFVHIIPSSQAKFNATVNRLGFDKARRLLAAWWILFVVFYSSYHLFFGSLLWGIYGGVVLVLISVRYITQLKKISSPAGSGIRTIAISGRRVFQIALLLWTIENFWYLIPWKR